VLSSFISLGDNRSDRLLGQLNKEPSDSVRLEILLELSRSFNKEGKTKEQCEDILRQALLIASSDSSFTNLSRVYNSYGVLYRNIAQYDEALKHHLKAIDYAQRANSNLLLASAYNSIGVVFRRMDNHPQATQYHLLGLKSAEAVDDTANIAVSLKGTSKI